MLWVTVNAVRASGEAVSVDESAVLVVVVMARSMIRIQGQLWQ